jgi:catechol-2,3-dioxygenase
MTRVDHASRAGDADPGVDMGHVHLEVTDLDRAAPFYSDELGFAGRR